MMIRLFPAGERHGEEGRVGRTGWELVAAVPVADGPGTGGLVLYFKRPK
jgi:hypothetical protein